LGRAPAERKKHFPLARHTSITRLKYLSRHPRDCDLLCPSFSVRSFARLNHDNDEDQNQDHYLDHDLPERNAYPENFNDEQNQHQDEDKNLHKYLVHFSPPVRFWRLPGDASLSEPSVAITKGVQAERV
jgi:hypothetical protein